MDQETVKELALKETKDLFMKYGIRSVTMDDIAQHLSVSKKTLYQLFKDKEEIITLVLREHFQMHMKEIDKIRTESSNAIEELYKISLFVRSKIRGINPGIIYDLQKYYRRVWNMYLELNRDIFYDSILKSIKWGIEDGYFRDNINPEILAILRIEEINMSFDNQIYPEEQFPLAEVHEQLYEHFIHGILTGKGLELLNQYKKDDK